MSVAIHYATCGTAAVITMCNPPVNGLGLELRQGIIESLERASSDDTIKSIVLLGSERAFSAGADVREFGTSRATQEPQLRTVIGRIEQCAKPVIAAIDGICMGGGLELALGCHYRLATPNAAIAFPEVKLGLIPGAGGTQRLPRLVGIEQAIAMITTGETIPAQGLAQTALFDEIAVGDLQAAALALANRIVEERRPLRRVRDIEPARDKADEFLSAARKRFVSTCEQSPAPLRCVEAIGAALDRPFDEGLRFERELFESLMIMPQSRALRHVFLAERALGKIPGISAEARPRVLEHVGVVGAGTMGRGIAMSFLNANTPVSLLETSREALSRGEDLIRKSYESLVKRGKLASAQMDRRMALLRPTLSDSDLSGSDLVIEAVFEDMDVKLQVFARLDAIAKPGAILASNTSTLDLNRLAASTSRPQDVIGLHFFSPAHVMRLLEIVRGERTADDVLVTCIQLAKRINKVAVVAGVCDGFIGNRMLHKFQAVAEEMLVQGASPAQVDKALEDFGMAMGPFKVADLAGLDVGWAIRKHRAKLNPSLATRRIADRICEAGRFGQKTSAGWYRYELGSREPLPDQVTDAIIDECRRERGTSTRDVSDAEIVAKCIYALVNEGARILEEGIASRSSDIDIVWLNGYGFPRYRGGPMHYANEVGLLNIVRALQQFETSEVPASSRWAPAPLLVRRAAEGSGFT